MSNAFEKHGIGHLSYSAVEMSATDPAAYSDAVSTRHQRLD
jgi:hypothetical protein